MQFSWYLTLSSGLEEILEIFNAFMMEIWQESVLLLKSKDQLHIIWKMRKDNTYDYFTRN